MGIGDWSVHEHRHTAHVVLFTSSMVELRLLQDQNQGSAATSSMVARGLDELNTLEPNKYVLVTGNQ